MRRIAFGGLLLLAAAAAPARADPGELEAVRREGIAAARETQEREREVAALERQVELLVRDAEARSRGLDETRPEQARLLGAMLHRARDPRASAVYVDVPIDAIRGELLMQAAEPVLRAQAHALSGEIARIAALRQRTAEQQRQLDRASEALAAARERLAALTARRRELARDLRPEDPARAAPKAGAGQDAKDVEGLIRSAEALAERRENDRGPRARSTQLRRPNPLPPETPDPTRPRELRDFNPSQAALVAPAAGKIAAAADGLKLSGLAGAEIVAPFDGRVVFAGPYADLGLVLIIRHGGGYHSVLAGLDRVDLGLDDWVLAGEPIGAMPGGSGMPLYFELRRDGRPVDPQPWLATRDDGRDERDGDQRMRQ